MKKLSFLLAALAIVLGLSQCKKPAMPSYSGPVGDRVIQHVTVSAGYGDSNSKLSLEQDGTAALKLTWTSGDVINVYEEGNDTPVSGDGLKIGKISEDRLTAEFSGDIVSTVGKELTFRVGDRPSSFESQEGTLDYIKTKMLCVEGTAPFDEEGNYDKIEMGLPYALLKLDLSYFGSDSREKDVTVTITKQAADKVVEQPIIASVTCATDALKSVYVAIPADPVAQGSTPETKTYIFEGSGKTVELDFAIGGNFFYTASGTEGGSVVIKPAAPTTPKFSVSADTKVEFAQGNLWYGIAEGESSAAFHFEANQWDYRTYANNAAHISGSESTVTTTPSGNWGLFGWSTSANNFGMSTSQNSTDYSGDFVDWGGVTGLPDAGEGKNWRTLSNAEWGYLLGTASPCRTNASSLRAWKVLDGTHKGLVILPDGTEASVMSSITSTSDLATYGAVFLPAAGYRYGTDVYYVGSRGYYWSSTPIEDNEGYAYRMRFNSGGANTIDDFRGNGYSVRLVR